MRGRDGAIRASSIDVPDTAARMVVRAGMLALGVGTIHFLINHGDHLADEPVCSHFFVKVALSYATPFVVSFVSSVLAARRARPCETAQAVGRLRSRT